MRALPRRWPVAMTAAWLVFAALAVVVALHGWRSFGFEQEAIDWSARHRLAAARHVAIAVTVLGAGVSPYLIALASSVVLVRSGGARTRRTNIVLLLFPLVWLVVGQLVRGSLMHGFGRLRPSSVFWATSANGFSFPSGHSFSSAVYAGLLALAVARRRPSWTGRVAVVAALYTLAVGLSRIYLGVHWPLDVVGSWLLAAGWLAAGYALLAAVDAGNGDATAPCRERPNAAVHRAYAYAGDTPVTNSDPSGLMSKDSDGGAYAYPGDLSDCPPLCSNDGLPHGPSGRSGANRIPDGNKGGGDFGGPLGNIRAATGRELHRWRKASTVGACVWEPSVPADTAQAAHGPHRRLNVCRDYVVTRLEQCERLDAPLVTTVL